MSDGASVTERLSTLRARIAAAARRAGRRPEEITVVGVAKRQAPELVTEAVRAGLERVGENYLQEALTRMDAVGASLAGHPGPRWHFIGQLQRNKARDVARVFDVVETVDRESLGVELDRRAGLQGRRLDILFQVNLSKEPQKGGIAEEELLELVAASGAWSHLRPIGLMTVPAASTDPERNRPTFARLRELAAALRKAPGGAELTELSMGMSGDFEVAVEEGATIVRVGTAIFGAR